MQGGKDMRLSCNPSPYFLFYLAGSVSSHSTSKPAPEPQGDKVTIDDLIQPPGRHVRPPKLVIIFRGLPGAGKTFIAKNVKGQESEMGSEAPRILTLDDYFECDGKVS